MISTDKMNKMRMFVLLLVCLTAGCTAQPKEKDCRLGEVRYTCRNEKCTMIGMSQRKGNRKMIITYPEVEKKRENFNQQSEMKDREFELDDDACVKDFPHTAYNTGRTTIACNLAHIINSSSTVRFFCKENDSQCSSSSGVSITQTSRGFNITIHQVTKENRGVYWCGLKENTTNVREKKNYSAAFQKIKLSVEDITDFKRPRTIGQNISYYCSYKNFPQAVSRLKFICKGDDPHMCQIVVNSSTPENGKFSMNDNRNTTNITVTIRELTAKDNGSYWCGAKTSDEDGGNVFINKLFLNIVPLPSSTSASPLIMTTVPSVANSSGLQIYIRMIICIVVLLLLLFVTVSILVCKRCSASKSSSAPNKDSTKEDYIYEDIQVDPLMPQSGPGLNSIYATATLPTMHPASLHYATINIQKRPDRDADDSQIHNHESCQYSTVQFRQSAASS